MDNILVIGIAGGSGSGKTTLMKNIIQRFGEAVTVISHDNYYKRHDDLTYEERCRLNYDEPAAFDTDLMVSQLKQLRQGKAIDCPVYDFTVHNRSEETIHIVPEPVDTDADIRLCRRIKRDVNKRGRTLESVLDQYQTTVKPMHEKYVEPSKKYANLVVPEGGKNYVALEMILSRIQRHLDGAAACV